MAEYKSAFSSQFSSTDFDVGRVTPYYIRDPVLNVMLLLKNKWSLTESGVSASDLVFTTGWFDSSLVLPQITITSAYNRKAVMECGDKPLYQYEDTLHVNIWVRPLQDSGRSLGQAKHVEYILRQEVERILRSGSHIGITWAGESVNVEEFVYIGRWRKLDEINLRPPLLRSMFEVKDNYFRETYEDV